MHAKNWGRCSNGSMPTRLVALTVAVVMAVGGLVATTMPDATAQNLSARDVDKLIEEYLAAETTPQRRSEIVGQLAGQSESRTRRPIQTAIRNAPTRLVAVRLALALRLSRTWDLIEPVAGGDDGAEVLQLVLEIGPAEMMADVAKYWAEKLPPTAPAFDAISEKFLVAGVSEAAVEILLKVLDDPGRGAAAAKILRAHLELSRDAAPPAIRAKWASTNRIYREQSKPWPAAGRNVFLDATFDGNRTRPGSLLGGDEAVQGDDSLPFPTYFKRRGSNYVLEHRQSIRFADLAPYQTRSHTVVMRFLPLNCQGFRLGYSTNRHQYVFELIENELRAVVMQNELKAPVKPGEWNELKFQVVMGRNNLRQVIVTLNGAGFSSTAVPGGGGQGGGRFGQGGPGGQGGRQPRGPRPLPFEQPLDAISVIGPHSGQAIVGGCEITID